MDKANLIGGLKNAMEHGSSLESTKRSFVNAGYSIDEVEEAARSISGFKPRMTDNLDMPTSLIVKPLPQEPFIQEGKFFTKKRILIFVMIGLVIIVGALFAGLFLG